MIYIMLVKLKIYLLTSLAKQFPHLTQEDLEDIIKNKNYQQANYHNNAYNSKEEDNNKVQVLYFNYKTYMNEVYKVKETGSGADKILPKDDTFNPPEIKKVILVKYKGL